MHASSEWRTRSMLFNVCGLYVGSTDTILMPVLRARYSSQANRCACSSFFPDCRGRITTNVKPRWLRMEFLIASAISLWYGLKLTPQLLAHPIGSIRMVFRIFSESGDNVSVMLSLRKFSE